MPHMFHNRTRRRRMILLSACLGGLGAVSGTAQQPAAGLGKQIDPAVRMELDFAEKLIEHRMHDYAQFVLGRIPDSDSVRSEKAVLEIRGMLGTGNFAEANAIIARRPDQHSAETWAMKLAMADAYFAWGKYDDFRKIYVQFFKSHPGAPPPALNDLYRDAAYTYARMLMMINEDDEAVKAYKSALRAKLDRDAQRLLLSELSELMLKIAESAPPTARANLLREIEKYLEKILYGGIDLWFGKALAMTAHARLMRGDTAGAIRILEDSMEQLVELDGILRQQEEESGESYTQMSPLAHARYMLGDIMLEQAKKIQPWPPVGENRVKAFQLLAEAKDAQGRRRDGALRHFMNVLYNYPGSQWAPEAGKKAEEVRRMIEQDIKPRVFNIEIDPERLAAVESAQFQTARVLFNQQQFEKAAEAYLRVLNIFPESETAIAALGELALCYIEIPLVGEVTDAQREYCENMVDLLVRYLGERFNKNADLSVQAGDRVLRVAGKYEELGRRRRRDALQDVFFQFFTGHPRTPALLFTVAQEALDSKNIDGAMAYFTRIADSYPGHRVYYPALNRMAQAHNQKGETDKEIAMLQRMVAELAKEEQPGPLYPGALYRLAHARRAAGLQNLRAQEEDKKIQGEKTVLEAMELYRELEKLLSGDVVKYQSTAEDAETVRRIREGSAFYIAFCTSLLTRPPEELEPRRRRAIESDEALLKQNPKSEFAPAAYSQIGTMWTLLQDAEKARDALDRLQKEHPQSPEAQNALFMLGMNLLELGMRDEATKVFVEMFRSTGTYSDRQVLAAGNELNKAGEYEIALQAFDRILGGAQTGTAEHEMTQLGRGRALLELGRHADAATALQMVVDLYPKSRSVVPASLFLSRAHAELAMNESDAAKRRHHFNEAIKRVNFVRRYDKTPQDRAKSTLAVADIRVLQVKAEEKFGTPETVRKNLPPAIMPLLTMIMSAQYDNIEMRPFIEEAFHRIVPLSIQDERWRDAYDQCQEYLKHFPRGRYVNAIREWRGQAQTRMVLLGIDADSAPGAAPEPEPPAGEPADDAAEEVQPIVNAETEEAPDEKQEE